jgi:predicted dithiol-disulfide oxidoreductase (DUF899 family)
VTLGPLHDVRFPGETDEYRAARDELLNEEIDLRRRITALARRRAELPLGGEVTTDYEFEDWDGAAKTVTLSDLFEDGKDTLYLYSFMWVPESQGLPFTGPCASCTSIIDALDGQVPHLTQRINVAVASKGPIDEFRAHGRSRGWRHARLLSARPSTYNLDYRAEDAEGNQWPLATVFVRREGKIHHFWSSELFFAPRAPGQGPRHVDFMWPMYGTLDRTPDGRGDFEPSLSYD